MGTVPMIGWTIWEVIIGILDNNIMVIEWGDAKQNSGRKM